MKKIGIVGGIHDKIFGIKLPYASFFEQYGVIEIIGSAIEVRNIDLLVLPGGLDILSIKYNHSPNYFNTRSEPFLEWFDTKVLSLYIEAQIPIIGICRGFHTLNTFFNGSLTQHLLDHETSSSYDRTDLAHSIHILKEFEEKNKDITLISDKVNSFHHQGVTLDDLSSSLIPVAIKSIKTKTNEIKSDEVEIFTNQDKTIWGLQYHPEEIYDENSDAIINYLLHI